MYAGGLSKQKGISYLLKAYKELDLPNSELLLVGDEYPDAKEIMATYKGLFRHIRFVPQEKLVHYYQQASVFVLPSLQDGFGMVVYEAAGCGMLVLIFVMKKMDLLFLFAIANLLQQNLCTFTKIHKLLDRWD